jgi:signal transduction histidine kinase
MSAFASKVFDPVRLQILQQSALLDSPPEEAFDRLTRLASRLLKVPISLVSLVDKDRQFFKSAIGLPDDLNADRQTPLSHSFCRHVVDSGQPLIVTDARVHPALKDNPIIPVGVVAYAGFPLVTGDGVVLGSFCAIDSAPREWSEDQLEILRDLTASVITEIQLRQANRQLQKTNEAKDRFMAMLSHDLRTPLTPALITASQLARDTSLPESCREDAQMIHRNIELEVRMIDSLLDVTRISSGKLHLHTESVDAGTLLCASAAMCRPDANTKSMEMVMDLRATRTQLQADSAKLQQVICNLLKNAIKFTPAGGRVTIESLDADNGQLMVRITDTGIGIDADRLAGIFDPFEQGEHRVTQQFGGLGLGLAISKGIVEAHGGTIFAASDGRGRGSTMTVLLSAESARKIPTRQPVVPASSSQQRPLRILLVEDQQDSLRAMSRLLRSFKHEVVPADSLANALAAADSDHFDLLISDLGLPDGSGLQLIQDLLKRGPIKGIALTGYGMESDIAQSQKAGFQKHLTKPIDFKHLQDAISELT